MRRWNPDQQHWMEGWQATFGKERGKPYSTEKIFHVGTLLYLFVGKAKLQDLTVFPQHQSRDNRDRPETSLRRGMFVKSSHFIHISGKRANFSPWLRHFLQTMLCSAQNLSTKLLPYRLDILFYFSSRHIFHRSLVNKNTLH